MKALSIIAIVKGPCCTIKTHTATVELSTRAPCGHYESGAAISEAVVEELDRFLNRLPCPIEIISLSHSIFAL